MRRNIEAAVEGQVTLVRVRPHGLSRELARRVSAIRSAAPLAPIDILAGSVLLRSFLTQSLAEAGGALGIRVSTLGEFGARLGEARMSGEGRRSPDALSARALSAVVSRRDTGYFEVGRDAPGFADAARRATRDVRLAGVPPRPSRRARTTRPNPSPGPRVLWTLTRASRRRAPSSGTARMVTGPQVVLRSISTSGGLRPRPRKRRGRRPTGGLCRGRISRLLRNPYLTLDSGRRIDVSFSDRSTVSAERPRREERIEGSAFPLQGLPVSPAEPFQLANV